MKIKKKPTKVVKLKKKATKEPLKEKYFTRTMTQYDDKGNPIMKVIPSGVPGQSDTLYNSGTREITNKLTGKKSKKILWTKKISPKDF
jgi:hypothetical protein